MTRTVPWTPAHYQGIIGPTVQSSSPNRPRPGKPVQPRDDGSNKSPSAACFGSNNDGPKKPPKPQPRDPGNGRQLFFDPQPRDPGSSNGRQFYLDPQPRDPGNGQYFLCGPQPRDDGCSGYYSGKPPVREPRPPQPREGGRKRKPQPRDPGF